MLTAFTRPPTPAIARCELTYMPRAPIDAARAVAQHRAYQRKLAEAGARVVSLRTLPDAPDAVFLEDTAVVLDGRAIVCRMGAASRRAEIDASAEALAPHREIVRLAPPATLEGGDVNIVGRTLLVGLSTRTNREGAAALRSIAEPLGYEVIEIPVTGCLHLTTACTAVSDGVLLANRAWIDAAPLRGFEFIEADPEEPWGGNALRVGDRLLCPAECPRTGARLERAGFDVRTTPISELMKAEAGLTCMSLVFETTCSEIPEGSAVIDPQRAAGEEQVSRPRSLAGHRSASDE
jgi:dimethylargininase